jgi:hypothetical protein
MPYFQITGITTTRSSRDPIDYRGETVYHLDLTTPKNLLQENSLLHPIQLPAVFFSLMTEFEEPSRSGAVERKKVGPTPAWRPTKSRGPLFSGRVMDCSPKVPCSNVGVTVLVRTVNDMPPEYHLHWKL